MSEREEGEEDLSFTCPFLFSSFFVVCCLLLANLLALMPQAHIHNNGRHKERAPFAEQVVTTDHFVAILATEFACFQSTDGIARAVWCSRVKFSIFRRRSPEKQSSPRTNGRASGANFDASISNSSRTRPICSTSVEIPQSVPQNTIRERERVHLPFFHAGEWWTNSTLTHSHR